MNAFCRNYTRILKKFIWLGIVVMVYTTFSEKNHEMAAWGCCCIHAHSLVQEGDILLIWYIFYQTTLFCRFVDKSQYNKSNLIKHIDSICFNIMFKPRMLAVSGRSQHIFVGWFNTHKSVHYHVRQ